MTNWNRFGWILIGVGLVLLFLSFVPVHFKRPAMLYGFRPEPSAGAGPADYWADRPLAPISLFIIQVGVICLFS